MKKRESERERERDDFKILYTGYLLSIVKIKREIYKEREREESEKKERGRRRER